MRSYLQSRNPTCWKLVIDKPHHGMEIWEDLGALKLVSARQHGLKQGSGSVTNESITFPPALLPAAPHFMYRRLAFFVQAREA